VPVPDGKPGETEEEPNPNDPDYREALGQARQLRNRASIDLALVKGVMVEVPRDDGWLEDLDLLGIPRPDVSTASARRTAYLKHELLRSAQDLTAVVEAVYRLTGVTEEGIAAAASKFRR
jgi:hypothetical protein